MSADLLSAHSTLINNGWKQNLFKNQTSDEFYKVLSGSNYSLIRYKKSDLPVAVYLGFYKNGQQVSDNKIKQLIESKKLQPLAMMSISSVYVLKAHIILVLMNHSSNSLVPPLQEAKIKT
jgi:hypothetical protein